ncbi:MAG: Methyl-accepting chemotaxis sensory transducer, partial [Candidatus Gallionella acididurans]
AGYALALIILVILGVVSYRTTTGLIDAAQMRAHSYQVLENLERVLSTLEAAETGQRGYIIVGEERYLEPYQAGVSSVNQAIQSLRELTADNPSQQQRLNVLESLVAAKLAELKETIDLRKVKGFSAALKVVRTDKGKKAMDDARKVIAEMGNEERMLLEQRSNEMKASSSTTISVIVYGIPFAFALLILVGSWITRTLTRQLRESVAQLSTSSAEILATTTQVASGAAETAASVSETTATVEEVKQTAQVSSQKARNVSDSAQKASQVSQNGRKSVEEAMQGMQRIQEQMESIAESIVRLSEQSQAIGEIIATVNDLAEQSNLLAVNAAIEANKAGEQGKGFAVVAQEVKSLAEQSKQATAQVRTILGDIQRATGAAVLATEQGNKAVQAGVKQTTETGEAIRLLADSIVEAAQAATQIAASSQQQMVGMDQVALAMENIKQASVQNVAGTKQAEVAAQSLHELGRKLSDMIGGKTR